MVPHAHGCIGLIALAASSSPAIWSEGQHGATAPRQVAASDPGTGQTPPATPNDEDAADGPDSLLFDLRPDALVYEGKHFWLRPIFAVVADYTFFEQDDPSLAQVGEQADSRDIRAARLGLTLRSKSKFPWEVYFAVDYQEPRTRVDRVFQLYDLRLRLPLGRVNVDIGKQKQPFAFEVVGLSIVLPQPERILSPFFVTRSIGIKASGQMVGDRMTFAVGWFNDWLESDATFAENANDYVARVTGLARVSADNRDYLHLGFDLRRAGPDIGMLRMSGRPESNVADKYVDTGDFSADYVNEVGVELVWDRGPFMLVAEHIEAQPRARWRGNPRFRGSYLLLSWVLTGESRPYIRSAGAIGPIAPTSRHGAVELVARYSHLDLTDGAIHGGVLRKWSFGVNWWISRQWKFGASYGDADLDRDEITGNTRMWLFRMQWYY